MEKLPDLSAIEKLIDDALKNGYTYESISKFVGVNNATVYNVHKAKNKPRYDVAKKIFDYLNNIKI